MATLVSPAVLQKGDLVRLTPGRSYAVYSIESVEVSASGRSVTITARHCRTNAKAWMELSGDTLAERLERIGRGDIENELSEMHPGDTLTITYWDTSFWA